MVTKLMDHLHLFAEGNRDFLYSPDIWAQVNNKLVTVPTACTETAKEDAKGMTKLYLQECIAIDQFVEQLYSSEICQPLSSIDTSTPGTWRHISHPADNLHGVC